jgi:hypothetical protein
VTQPLHLQQQSVGGPLGRYTVRHSRSADVWTGGWPIAPVPAQASATHLGSRQRHFGSLTDKLALLLRHRRVAPHHQIVGAWHVGGADGKAILKQLRRLSPVTKPASITP